ncbi:hypothetical protein AWC38_SpisGene4643 [Stylophora pistillata]|uniref:Homeobox protein SIX1 N-terminal SD domain-containing protein n=1 Tax=Stylophora pistillata TaxID=50429 RepID=A0A2B4SQ13_STYPI|nr:hypothetical protein AWC38_SpisGene4643 [Stylophora pistillata]
MAYVLALRKGTSKRTKKKILLKNGEEGLLDRSTLATQWPTLPCLPFAGVRKTDRSRNTTSQSTSELQTWLDSFPGKVKENEKMIFKKIDEAWQRKDIDEMFQLIKENEFSDETQKKALHYWDQGHYYQEGEKRNKALTPLARFRIRESPPEPWQVPILTTMTSTPSTVPPCASFCTCPPHVAQILVPTSLSSNVSDYWTELNCNAGTLTDWPGSYAGTVGNQYLAPQVVALAPNLWEPELQCQGLHAAAQILMNMASK